MRTKSRTYHVLRLGVLAFVGRLTQQMMGRGHRAGYSDERRHRFGRSIADTKLLWPIACFVLGLAFTGCRQEGCEFNSDCSSMTCPTGEKGICYLGGYDGVCECRPAFDGTGGSGGEGGTGGDGGTGGMAGSGGSAGSGGGGEANSCPDIEVPEFASLGLKDRPRPGSADPVPDDPDAWAGTNYLVDGDFEDERVFSGGVPTGSGYWAFDQAWSAESQQGIPAQSGSRMLHFVGSSPDGLLSEVGSASEQIQLVDVSALRSRIDAGKVEVEASAYFNRVAAGDPPCLIDNSFGILLKAYDGEMADFPVRISSMENPALGSVQERVSADDDPETWGEPLAVTLILPPNTTYVEVRLYINEDGFNDAAYPEFHGHYADNASLTVRLVE